MWLGNNIIQLKIDSSELKLGAVSSTKLFHFAGCSFMVFVKTWLAHEPCCKVALCVFLNRKESRHLISLVSVLMSSGTKTLNIRELPLQGSTDSASVYLEDFSLQKHSGPRSLLVTVHLKQEILSSLGWPNQSLWLWKAAQEKKVTDVIIRVEGKELAAHKAILCISSPVFEAMFSSNMKEAQSGVVNIEDITAETFEEFLRFLYTGYVKDSQTLETLRGELRDVAEKYDVPPLKILSSSTADGSISTMCCLFFELSK